MSTRWEGGQSTVELAGVLFVVLLLVLTVVQVGLVTRDQLLAVHAARVAARAVIVDPTTGAAADALRRGQVRYDSVRLSGDSRPGGMATVEVRLSPTRVPVVGRLLGDRVVSESLSVMVE